MTVMAALTGYPDTEEAFVAVVRQAWIDALPNTPFDAEQSWEASGADSLRSLHLVLNLERALGRKVPFDLITRQMTPRDLARRLALPAENAHRADAPTVFLVPGVFGDGPILAEFRRSFAGGVRFVVMDLPDMEVPVKVHADLPATGRLVAEAIRRQTPGDKPICIAGFSYGGIVAFEAARYLQDRGCQVAFLGLLDSFPSRHVPVPTAPGAAAPAEQAPPEDSVGNHGGLLAKIKPRRGENVIDYGERVAFGLALMLGKADLARRVTLAGRKRLSQDQFIGRRKIVLGLGRMRAIDAWSAAPLTVPTFLACTDDGEQARSPAIWASFCARLQVQRIPGGHYDIFSPKALAILTPAFREAVLAALQQQAGGAAQAARSGS